MSDKLRLLDLWRNRKLTNYGLSDHWKHQCRAGAQNTEKVSGDVPGNQGHRGSALRCLKSAACSLNPVDGGSQKKDHPLIPFENVNFLSVPNPDE